MGKPYQLILSDGNFRHSAITGWTNNFPISLAGTNTVIGSQWVFYNFLVNGLGTNQYAAGSNVVFTFNAGIYSINAIGQTNGYGTAVYSNGYAFATTQQLSSATNQLASTNYVNIATSGFIRAADIAAYANNEL